MQISKAKLGIGLVLGAGIGLLGASLTAEPSAGAVTKPDDTDDLKAALSVLRSDINTAKIATLNQVMKLTGPEAEVFWPVYREYEKELAAVGDRKLELIREFSAAHFGGTLDNKQAADLAQRWLKNTQDRLDLWKKYHKRISAKLSPMRGAQFLQIENQMALFVDLNIAAEMPAVGARPPGLK
jgi:hypothetical protein